MYTLTLTSADRKAFDWVGHRYATGDIRDILETCLPENACWQDEGDLSIDVDEGSAECIDIFAWKEGYAFPCFSTDLRDKMRQFCDSIV